LPDHVALVRVGTAIENVKLRLCVCVHETAVAV